MRGVAIAFAAMLGLSLAGCLGVTIPPKELPAWAMQPQAADVAPMRQRTARRQTFRTVTQHGAPDQTTAVSYAGPAKSSSETMPFSPEWTARENALDDRLRRRMHICGGC
jgi:hypothetical protein